MALALSLNGRASQQTEGEGPLLRPFSLMGFPYPPHPLPHQRGAMAAPVVREEADSLAVRRSWRSHLSRPSLDSWLLETHGCQNGFCAFNYSFFLISASRWLGYSFTPWSQILWQRGSEIPLLPHSIDILTIWEMYFSVCPSLLLGSLFQWNKSSQALFWPTLTKKLI